MGLDQSSHRILIQVYSKRKLNNIYDPDKIIYLFEFALDAHKQRSHNLDQLWYRSWPGRNREPRFVEPIASVGY
jgi:hypothetical protein